MFSTLLLLAPRRSGAVVAVTALALGAAGSLAPGVVGPAPAAAATAVAGEVTQVVTHNGTSLTVRLAPVSLRAPGFEVLVQQADGSLTPRAVGGERSYLGSVDGNTAAVATAIRRSDGVLEGTIVFDRGATWRFRDGTVHSTRGLTPPSSFRWPSASAAARNVSTAPGQAGGTTYRWDIGYDLANDWFVDPGTVDGSVARALDAVESEVAEMAGLYVTDALLRPALGRVIIRADAARDPYAVKDGVLGKITDEWDLNQADADVDVVVGRHTPNGGGGVAWVGTAGSGWTGASVAGAGNGVVVSRHEIGHNWGVHDNHTNGPEGATVMSGNQYARFDGTELAAIFRHRDGQQARNGAFTDEGAFPLPVPPYAALDLVDGLDSGVPRRFLPLANDHDANGEALTLVSAPGTSALGGKISLYRDQLTFTPPTVSAAGTVDSVTYVVRDASGRTATGVALFRVDPYVAPGPVSSWPAAPVQDGFQHVLTNRQSGYQATLKPESPTRPEVVQRPTSGKYATWVVQRSGTGHQLKNLATGRCVEVPGGSTATGTFVAQATCADLARQQWRVVQHPEGGVAFVNVGSGLCLAPGSASISVGGKLAQVACDRQLASAWDSTVPAVGAWTPAAAPAAGQEYTLQNVTSGRHLGLPVGTTDWVELVQRAAGVGTRFTFRANADGTFRVTEVSGADCVDAYGSTAGTWGCHDGDNQRWTLLHHPGGGVALRNLRSGKCLAPADASRAEGSKIALQACGTVADRWTLAAVGPTG